MIRTDMMYSDLVDDEGSLGVNKGVPFENFCCPSHPGYRVEVMCTKENFTPALLCIKCLINPEIHKHSDSFIPIHDIINKGTSAQTSETQIQSAREKLEKRFIEFSSVDYLAIYERHSDSQLLKLNKEVARIKESLEDLELQFKQLFEKESNHLKDKQEEIKVKIQQFIDEQEQIESLHDLTRDEIIDTMGKLDNIKDYEKLLKVLFHRASLSESVTKNALVNDIFNVMDELRAKVNTMKNYKIDTTRLEDIRQRIDSIEMLDQSLQTFPSSLNPNLAETLEIIRKADKHQKKSASPKQPDPHSSLKKRADFLGPLQEKILAHDRRDTMDDSPRNDYYTKRENYSPRDRSGNQMVVEDAAPFVRDVDAGTQTSYRKSDDDYYRRFDDERYRKRQKMHAPPHRDRHSRDRDDDYQYTNDWRQDYDRYDDDDFGYTSHVKTSVKSKANKQSVSKNKTEKKSISKDHKKSTTKRDEEDRRDKSSKNKPSQKKNKGSLDKWVTSEHRDKQSKKNLSKKKGDLGDQSDDSRSRSSSKRKGKRVMSLHDWIHRRITGYLIFQNTIRDNKPEKERDDDHLNALTGKMWKEFSKAEREEYRRLALEARADFKRDFDDVSKSDPEIKNLQEQIEKKLKNIKKE